MFDRLLLIELCAIEIDILCATISTMPDSELKDKLLKTYELHITQHGNLTKMLFGNMSGGQEQ